MKVTMTPTDQIHNLDGCECRLWTGTTENGLEVGIFVHRVIVHEDADASKLESLLIETSKPQVHETKQTDE